MTWKLVRARTTKISRTRTGPRQGLEHYCRDLNGWPRSWMGLEKDLPPGEQLLTLFRPFLEYLAASDLSPQTIQKHVDNIWALGGEFIQRPPQILLCERSRARIERRKREGAQPVSQTVARMSQIVAAPAKSSDVHSTPDFDPLANLREQEHKRVVWQYPSGSPDDGPIHANEAQRSERQKQQNFRTKSGAQW